MRQLFFQPESRKKTSMFEFSNIISDDLFQIF